MRPLFVFGTLRHPPLLAAVAGGKVAALPALLADHAAARALAPDGSPQPFPLLVARPGAAAEGLLLRPDAPQRARLDAYETRPICSANKGGTAFATWVNLGTSWRRLSPPVVYFPSNRNQSGNDCSRAFSRTVSVLGSE